MVIEESENVTRRTETRVSLTFKGSKVTLCLLRSDPDTTFYGSYIVTKSIASLRRWLKGAERRDGGKTLRGKIAGSGGDAISFCTSELKSLLLSWSERRLVGRAFLRWDPNDKDLLRFTRLRRSGDPVDGESSETLN